MTYLTIRNDGAAIAETDYWTSEIAKQGLLFCSVNAGAIRVLLPLQMEEHLPDMKAAPECVLSRGPWPVMKLLDAFELMWDDGGDSPFALHLAPECFTPIPAEPPSDREWIISVWVERNGQPHKEHEWICRWRRSKKLPDLRPWEKN